MAAPHNPMKGEAHLFARVNEDDVRLIRLAAAERYRLLAEAAKLSNAALGDKFDLSESQVGRIIAGKAWKDVGDEL